MHTRIIVTAVFVLALCGSALGTTLTPEEIKQLGTTLTPVGAEKAGNKDGTIPAYTGGLTTPPPGFKKGSTLLPDPFAAEKRLFSIDAKNMSQYADKLTQGTKAMMGKYPDFRIDVYPSHRTAAFPKFVNENTIKRAGKASLVEDGEVIKNAKASIPFPIPKNGNEAMWNHQLRYTRNEHDSGISLTVDSNGRMYESSRTTVLNEVPYWDESKNSQWFAKVRFLTTSPPRMAGEALLVFQPLNFKENAKAYIYLPGQRRVKLAPEYSFDSPDSSTSGGSVYDDNNLFNGSYEKYNWKLVEKVEKYIPYNTYKLSYASKSADIFKTKHFLNPDYVRWELHRVWVVEATLKPGQRHIYKRRVFYLDEDTWSALATDIYDAQGKVYRTNFAYFTQFYDSFAPMYYPFGGYDLITRQSWLRAYTAETGGVKFTDPLPSKEWSPENLSSFSSR